MTGAMGRDEGVRPRVGIFGLTGCAGDQLQILNCEDELLQLAESVAIADWVMAKSENDHTSRLDIGFVEGVVATERDLDALRKIRARTRFLVAIGTCAVWGGLPAMRNDLPRDVLEREVYHVDRSFLDSVEALPPTHFVRFELLLPGATSFWQRSALCCGAPCRSCRRSRCAGSARSARTNAASSSTTRSAAAR
jgi:coenzyme F420-reducing hydrogenase gamma subunit